MPTLTLTPSLPLLLKPNTLNPNPNHNLKERSFLSTNAAVNVDSGLVLYWSWCINIHHLQIILTFILHLVCQAVLWTTKFTPPRNQGRRTFITLNSSPTSCEVRFSLSVGFDLASSFMFSDWSPTLCQIYIGYPSTNGICSKLAVVRASRTPGTSAHTGL